MSVSKTGLLNILELEQGTFLVQFDLTQSEDAMATGLATVGAKAVSTITPAHPDQGRGPLLLVEMLSDQAPEHSIETLSRLPGVAFADIPNGVAAINAIPALGWLQMVFLIGAVDYWGVLGDFSIGKPELDDEELERRKLCELQHGRIAMLATLELLRHDSQNFVSPGFDGLDKLITGLPFLYN
jgi:hypothetical protein